LPLTAPVEKADAVFEKHETASVSRHSGDRSRFDQSISLLRWAGTEALNNLSILDRSLAANSFESDEVEVMKK
jgi:hypothetical protein